MNKPNRTVKIKYFKDSGKYYSEGEYTTEKEYFHETVLELNEMLSKGINPGLMDNSCLINGFFVYAEVPIGIQHQIETEDWDAKIPILCIPGKHF